MIGWYVHHHGAGHLHRARAVAAELARPASGRPAEQVTGLSSLPRPPGWEGPWVRLPPDVDPSCDALSPEDRTAGGVLHWAPRGHEGLRHRTAKVSAWLDRARPRAVVVDVSQEVALLCRLHGVPVVSVVLPGRRTDGPHRLGLRCSEVLVGCWPADDATTRALLPGLPQDLTDRVRAVGALSRFAPAPEPAPAPAPGTGRHRRRLVLLGGRGGDAWTPAQAAALTDAARDAGWDVVVLGPGGTWRDEVWDCLRSADVVVAAAGQNAVAEVAAARVPAVLVAAGRPFDEQAVAARHLADGPWPAASLPTLEDDDWAGLLDRVEALDGEAWSSWCDGGAAGRFADVLAGVPA